MKIIYPLRTVLLILLSSVVFGCTPEPDAEAEITAQLAEQVYRLAQKNIQYHEAVIYRWYMLDPDKNTPEYEKVKRLGETTYNIQSQVKILPTPEALRIYRTFAAKVVEEFNLSRLSGKTYVDTLPLENLPDSIQKQLLPSQLMVIFALGTRHLFNRIGTSSDGYYSYGVIPDTVVVKKDTSSAKLYMYTFLPWKSMGFINDKFNTSAFLLINSEVTKDGRKINVPIKLQMPPINGQLQMGLKGRGNYHVEAEFLFKNKDTTFTRELEYDFKIE